MNFHILGQLRMTNERFFSPHEGPLTVTPSSKCDHDGLQKKTKLDFFFSQKQNSNKTL